jgi:hypothetical protein
MPPHPGIAADCFRPPAKPAENMGLFAANPEPIIERTFRQPPAGLAAKPRYKSGLSRKKRPQPVQKTSQSGYLGRGGTVFPVRPAQFIVVPLIHPPKKPARAILHAPLKFVSRCRKRRLSRDAPCDRNRIQQRIS